MKKDWCVYTTSLEAPSLLFDSAFPSYREIGKSSKYMQLSVGELARWHLEKEKLVNMFKSLPTHLSGVDLCSICLSATVTIAILISPVPS